MFAFFSKDPVVFIASNFVVIEQIVPSSTNKSVSEKLHPECQPDDPDSGYKSYKRQVTQNSQTFLLHLGPKRSAAMRNFRAVVRVGESLNGQLVTPHRHVFKYCSRQKYARDYRPSLRRPLIQRPGQRNLATTSSLDGELNAQQEEKSPIRFITGSTRLEFNQEPNTIKIGTFLFDTTLLRDACSCSECVDPSTTQKNFRTTDIASEDWKVQRVEVGPTNTTIRWKKKRASEQHISTFANDELSHLRRDHSTIPIKEMSWDASDIDNRLGFFDYKDYMTLEATLHQALRSLAHEGLIILSGIPESEKSVEEIAGRIGSIRDTFYGRTWNVKSVPEAKNVAYTSKYLGLHMDLLYMANPPGFQLLHCLKNTASGGDSIFSDCKQAVKLLSKEHYKLLCSNSIAYHYKNAGEHYHYSHPVIESVNPNYHQKGSAVRHFNYSPPFQAPYARRTQERTPSGNSEFLNALSEFSSLVEDPQNLFSYKLKEGECVVFNNRRILHGRQAFDAEGGERWLKGTYVDTDVVASRLRVLNAKFPVAIRRLKGERVEDE